MCGIVAYVGPKDCAPILAEGLTSEYTVEVIWSVPGCSGTIYKVRFPAHGLADHAEIEVRGSAGALKGRLVATKGSLPVLYNQANVALPTHKRGPFAQVTSIASVAEQPFEVTVTE